MPTTDWIIQAVIAWISHGANLLVPMATTMVRSFAVGMTAYYGLLMLVDAVIGHHPHAAREYFTKWLPSIVVTTFFLRYYNTPLPWGGVSFHQILPEGARFITNLINTSTMSAATTAMDGVIGSIIPPTSKWDFLGNLIYLATVGVVWLAEGVMFAVTNIGFIALGIGIVLGPLSIACRLFPPLAHLWRHWLDYMVSWSFFQVVAASVTNIWANVLILGIPQIIHSGLTVEALVVLKAFILINVALIWTCKNIDKFTAGLYGHAVSGSAGYASYIRSWV